MINVKDLALEYLMPTLGVPRFYYNQVKFNCPKCDRGNKYNLEIHTEHLGFNCWSCHYKGHLGQLLREYAKNDSWLQINEFKNKSTNYLQKTETKILELPTGIVPFHYKKEVNDYLLQERKINKKILIQRKVGYVYGKNEPLFNHIIFPFYDITGTKLTGFSVQNFETKKYKNFGKRDFIPYIQFINVNYPIVLTEGIYDAFSIFNGIPLLGTEISKVILEFISNKNIILALDNEVAESDKCVLIDKLKKYSAKIIYDFNTEEFKDLNKFKQEDSERLILKYKYAVETIFENIQ